MPRVDEHEAPGGAPRRGSPARERWLVWLLAALAVGVTLWWSSPLWLNVGRTGSFDWGTMLNAWEVRWRTVFDYHQWPEFNPWQGGGLPVNPALGWFSIQAAATLLFGPKAGLDVFIICYLLIGLWGFWRLSLDLFPENRAAAAFLATLGTASPALAYHLTAGHLIFANLLVWPAIFSYILRAEKDRWSGLKAGLLFALGFNELPFYVMQYGGVIAGVLWLWRLSRAGAAARRRLGRMAVLGTSVALPFLIPSVVGILRIARDYPRVANTPASFTAAQLLHAYFVPDTRMAAEVFVPTMHSWWGTWEINCYLGIGAACFFAWGLVRRRQWFHMAALGCFLFTIGNLHWWEPMRWLMATPLFASLQSFGRLRLFTYLFFSVGAAWGFVCLWQKTDRWRWRRVLLGLVAAASVAEVAVVSHGIARRSHLAFIPPPVRNAEGGRFYQMSTRRGLPGKFDGWPADLMLYTRANIGIVDEPAAVDLSALRLKSRVRTIGHAGYVGEFSQDGRPVTPAYWSPNRIAFVGLNPAMPLTVNLNRGNPWCDFGRPLFPGDRIVEFQKPFTVKPDARGRVELTYRLPGLGLAWAGSGVAAVIALALVGAARRESGTDGT